jgi:hypothetical protein
MPLRRLEHGSGLQRKVPVLRRRRSSLPDLQKRHFAYMLDARSMSIADRAAFVRNEWADAF